MNSNTKLIFQKNSRRALVSFKWILFSIIVGLVVGFIGTFFSFGLSFVTVLRNQNGWLILLLPIAVFPS